MSKDQVRIRSRDYWFKVVGMLQHNWALVERRAFEGKGVRIHFVADDSRVFDEIDLELEFDARRSLRHNGFQLYAEDEEAQEVISPPEPPFYKGDHPNGKIYSSGEYWSYPPEIDR